jgi:DNA repair exonuclease SbcCD nuclease subunit
MILYTADWHIKLGQKNVPIPWALNRYDMFFAQITELEKECDLHIIGGDLFDRVPTLDEEALYHKFILGITIPTIIYDGNHEATKKNKTFFDTLRAATEKLNPLVEVITTSQVLIHNNSYYGILPYCDLHKKSSIESLDHDMPIFTHVRGEIPPHVKPEVDLDRFDKFPIVFAGDLHAHSNTQRNIVYPGSPMTTSFHRNEVKTGCILINEQDWSWEWKELVLPQLIRETVTDPSLMVSTDFHHTIYELEGDLHDLASIKDSELLDKKVVKRSSEATLVLGKDMTIQEELIEYLTYVLELDENNIPDIIGIFNDYAPTAEME